MKKIILMIAMLILISGFASADLTDGLVSYWDFDEGAGSTAYDSADGNDGTLNGDPQWVTGKVGDYALDFDGSGDYVDVGANWDIRTFTLESWVSWDGTTKSGESYVDIMGRRDDHNVWLQLLIRGSDGQIGAYDGSGAIMFAGSDGLQTDIWNHLVFVANNNGDGTSQLTLYQDGENKGDIQIDVGFPNRNFIIGKPSITDGSHWRGLLDEVAIWNRALSSSEISELYNSGDGYNPLIAYEVIEPASWNGFDLHDSEGNLIESTTTETDLYIQEGTDKKVEFNINDDVNLSEVFVDADSSRTVVSGLDTALGVTGTHSLYVPITEATGVYVCPHAETLSEVVPGCQDEGSFTYSECDGATPKTMGGDTVTCEIVSNDYKVSGLTGSSASETNDLSGTGSVPEFSSMGMVLALLIAGLGIALVIKKRR